MKKKTSNVQHSTLNAQRDGRVAEERGTYAARKGQNDLEVKFDLEDRLLDFTARLIKLVDALPASRAGNHIAGQLLRCGTSPYAHHGEVQAAESRRDLIHKLSNCRKELKESRRWLRLIARVELISGKRVGLLLSETEELIRIFSASIRTAEKNAR